MTPEREQELRQAFLYARQNPGFQVGFASDERDFVRKLIRTVKTPKEPVPKPDCKPKRLLELVTPEQEQQMVELLRRDWWNFEEIGSKFGFSDSVVRQIAQRHGLETREKRLNQKT